MGKFIISQRSNGEFQFLLKAGNGQIILSSEGYSQRKSCSEGIRAVIKYSQNPENFERKNSINGKYYFILKATNGQVVGTSLMYESVAGRENGIYSVMENANQKAIA